MTEFWNSIVTVLMAIIGIAALALIVSRQSNTSGVIQAGSQGFSTALGTALSPVTGATQFSNFGSLTSPVQPANFL